jgi:hypothetical protein
VTWKPGLGIQNGHRNLTALDDRVEKQRVQRELFGFNREGQHNYFIEDIDGDGPSGVHDHNS